MAAAIAASAWRSASVAAASALSACSARFRASSAAERAWSTALSAPCKGLADDELALVGTGGRGRERDGDDLDLAAQDRGGRRQEWPGLVGIGLVAADEQVRRGLQEVVEGPRQARLGAVGLAGHAVDPDVVGLEEGAEAVVVGLRDRVVLVVVAAGAVDRQAEEGLGGVLDGVRRARRCG